MHKTLLLCFIHGFKGGDDTFGGFPKHLRALLSHALPEVTVTAVTYPSFETRGDLAECVSRFREWLQNVVIDIEVSASTPSPTIDPSVHTILIGHSMGGIVAADTLLSITSDAPISAGTDSDSTSSKDTSPPSPPSFMFPHIQGILAFDTPYLGISPGVVAHGAETHYKTASTAYSTLTDMAGAFGWGASTSDPYAGEQMPKGPQQKALTAGPEAAKEALSASMTSNADAAATPMWQRWGKYAMFAGAAGAVAAGGAAAYLKKDSITEGWSWVGSHLEFVGCLVRGEELKNRLGRVVKLHKEKGIGFANLITVLGRGGAKKGKTVAGGFIEIGAVDSGEKRTFCTTPKSSLKSHFEGTVNDKASDETVAHMSMFFPRDNPGYYGMSERAKELIVSWVDMGWYGTSVADAEAGDDIELEDSEGVESLGDESLGNEEPVFVGNESHDVWR